MASSWFIGTRVETICQDNTETRNAARAMPHADAHIRNTGP
ncbi:hypothetical protein [Embleya hyalina]|uniref:Uncharacterized protein n=1 Tax=Embleya hyalina TaxID=516124 RepID=A0A401YN74_9ACTN|nr:hypothetical protein [Embleya hyalina]GCD96027.1 hypothetical protein EHYA_03711 [Embleya hyalina]